DLLRRHVASAASPADTSAAARVSSTTSLHHTSAAAADAAAAAASGRLADSSLVASLLLNEIKSLESSTSTSTGIGTTLTTLGEPPSPPRGVTSSSMGSPDYEQGYSHPRSVDVVIAIDVPDEIVLQRIADRWIHEPSGRTYNDHFNPPKVPGQDDVTGEPLTRRPDDARTAPILRHYEKRGVLRTFAGSSSKELFPRLRAAVEPLVAGSRA
ncbi:hypothetical protein HK405_002828, partial [Cladochytrium tenue]